MTGLIYVVIIAVWAVVLVPAWLRRHDHQDPERSIGRFSRAMDNLAHGPGLAADAVERGTRVQEPWAPQDTDATVHVVRRAERRPQQPQPGSHRGSTSTAVARRRAVLIVLGIVLVAVTGLVLIGSLAPATVGIPLALIGAFLVAARVQVRRGRVGAATPARPARSGYESGARTSQSAVASDRLGDRSEGTWQPTSTPLPNYITAPPAPSGSRTNPAHGAWTSATMLERAQQEKLRQERMERAKRDAIAQAKAEQAAAEKASRDEEFLAAEASVSWLGPAMRRRAVNE